jgi:hypothetical protein
MDLAVVLALVATVLMGPRAHLVVGGQVLAYPCSEELAVAVVAAAIKAAVARGVPMVVVVVVIAALRVLLTKAVAVVAVWITAGRHRVAQAL